MKSVVSKSFTISNLLAVSLAVSFQKSALDAWFFFQTCFLLLSGQRLSYILRSSNSHSSLIKLQLRTDVYLMVFSHTFSFGCRCFFYKQHFYKQHQAETNKKIKQILNFTMRLNF